MLEEKPFFDDFVYGIKGTYISSEPAEKSGEIYIFYVPINGLALRKYPSPIPKEAKIGPISSDEFAVTHPDRGFKNYGVQKSVIYVIQNNKGETGIYEEITGREARNITKLREDAREEKIDKEYHKTEKKREREDSKSRGRSRRRLTREEEDYSRW